MMISPDRNLDARRSRRRCSRAAIALSSFLVTASALGDQLVVEGKNYPSVDVTSMSEGLLRFRDEDGVSRDANVADLDLIVLDAPAFSDFNQAERLLAGGEAKQAAVRYERALRLSSGFWSDLITVRLLVAYDKSMQVDRAAQQLIRVLYGRFAGPAAAANLIPMNLPSSRSGSMSRGVRELDSALAKAPAQPIRIVLELARFEMVRRMDAELARVAANRIAAQPIPASTRCDRVYEILVRAIEMALASESTPSLLTALDRAIENCPERFLPDFLMMKGQALADAATTRDDLLRAIRPFLRIPIHMPKDPRAPEALLAAAKLLRRLDDEEGASTLIEECLAYESVPEAVRLEASRIKGDMREQ